MVAMAAYRLKDRHVRHKSSSSISSSCFRYCVLAFILVLITIVASMSLFYSPPNSSLPASVSNLPPLSPSPFDPLLLSSSRVDLGDAQIMSQAQLLLHPSWSPSFLDRLSDLFFPHQHQRLEAARLRFARSGILLPMQISARRYALFWPQFQTSLRKWVDSKHYEPSIMNSLVHLVKDRIDKHYSNRGKLGNSQLKTPYRTCAVVGNSGILLNQSFASFIDAHDAVIRLNNARTAGFEEHVGSKTTIAFINSHILQMCARRNRCFCHPYGDDVPIVLYICQTVHFLDVALCEDSIRSPIIVTDPRLDILCSRIAKYYSMKNFVESTGRPPEDWSEVHDGPMFHYSSGMQAVMLALGICKQVSIFGFGKSPGAKHHYHTNQKGELHLHDYTAEYQFYHDLVHNRSSLIPFLSEAGFLLPKVVVYM